MPNDLSYKDRWIYSYESFTDEPEPDFNPIRYEGDEARWILLKLTAPQVKEVLSALYVGSTLTYREDARRVYWHLVKHLEYPYMFCDLIAECIRNSIGSGNDLDQALDEWLNSRDPGDLLGGIADADNDLLNLSTCDNDILFGMCRQLVNWMDFAIRDLFEYLEAFTNFIEFWGALAKAVPLLGRVVDLAEAIQDSFYDAYLANHSEALEQEYACDLFCLAIAHDCKLTWKDIEYYFAEKMQFDPSQTIGILAEILLTGSFVAEEYVAMFYHLLAYTLWKGSDWAGVDLDGLSSLMLSWQNDPDPDWAILCDTCDVWRATFDFAADDCNMVIGSFGGLPTAAYDPGSGYRATNWVEPVENDKTTRCLLNFPITTSVKVNRVQFSVDEWDSGGGFMAGEWTSAFAGQYANAMTVFPSGLPFIVDKNFDLDLSTLGNCVDIRCTNRNRYGGGTLISKMVVWGTGTPPQEFLDNATEFTYL